MKLRLVALIAGLLLSWHVFAANPVVEVQTSMGNFTLELYPEQAPKTVENFMNYVKSGFYNGTVFHRVIEGFMIQGGGFDEQLHKKETLAPIQNEANNGLKNDAFTIAMARTPYPDSATSQFFINLVDNNRLNYSQPTMQGWGYAVFGKVLEGRSVVEKIGQVPTGTRAPLPSDVPLVNVVIEQVKVIR